MTVIPRLIGAVPCSAVASRRVLVIEDDETFLLLVRLELEAEDALDVELHCVTGLADGLAALERLSFDVVLTDLNLPDSAGIETFEALIKVASQTPIIVFSNQSDENLAGRILRKGAQDYVQKSRLDHGVLPRVISRAIERHSYAIELDHRARQLEESEARVRAIYEASEDAVVVTDDRGLVRFANPAAGVMFGRNPRVLIDSAFGFPLTSGRTTEIDIVRSDGTVGIAEMRVVDLPWGGQPAKLALLRDFTDRKRVEQCLRASEERFRLLVEHAVDYVFVMLDGNGCVTTWNAGAERATGYRPSEILGQPLQRSFLGQDWAMGQPLTMLDKAREDGRTKDEGWFLRRDGSRFWAQVLLTAIYDEDRSMLGFAMVAHDLSERREAEIRHERMEEQLRNAHKLEAIGQLAAGVAHEINTPAQYIEHNLRFVRSNFERLLAGFDPDARPEIVELVRAIPEALDDALEGVSRVTGIVKAMRTFSHPGKDGERRQELTDINEIIANAVILSRNEWRQVAEVETELATDLPPVPLFASEFSQVVLNLLLNASHAIADALLSKLETKGLIKISTVEVEGTIEVRITDTGLGIPAAIRHRVFEPFFTTKDVGKGTGQGLAHAHAVIVQQHKGLIDFQSTPGVGTCFTLKLPLKAPKTTAIGAIATDNHD